MEELQAKFFNLDQPCPEEIPDCQKLRDDYNMELKKYKDQGMCSGCIERSLRNKYITFILATTNV